MQLQDWLCKHGCAAVQVTVHGQYDRTWVKRVLQLPFPQLTQLRCLELGHIHAQLPQGVLTRSRARRQRGSCLTGTQSIAASRACDAAAAAAAVLPQLQELKLSYCRLTMQLLRQLLSAPALTKLQWEWVHIHSDSHRAEKLPLWQVLPAIWQQLQQLPKLSELQLNSLALTAADLMPVSTLQRLQYLTLPVLTHEDAAAVAAVVLAGLTALEMQCSLISATYPEVCPARFIHLQSFSGACVCIPFRALGSITGLRQLRLYQPIDAYGQQLSQSGARELLSALQHLTQLQHLELLNCHLGCAVPQQWLSGSGLAATSASQP